MARTFFVNLSRAKKVLFCFVRRESPFKKATLSPENGYNRGMQRTPSTPLTDEHRALLACPTVASQLPVKFNNGFSFTGMTGHCSRCNQPIADEAMFGKMLFRPNQMVEVHAIGCCTECKLATMFLYRMYDDARFMTYRNDGWYHGQMRKSRWDQTMDSVKRSMRWLFTF